jgi:hypothetical protein
MKYISTPFPMKKIDFSILTWLTIPQQNAPRDLELMELIGFDLIKRISHLMTEEEFAEEYLRIYMIESSIENFSRIVPDHMRLRWTGTRTIYEWYLMMLEDRYLILEEMRIHEQKMIMPTYPREPRVVGYQRRRAG